MIFVQKCISLWGLYVVECCRCMMIRCRCVFVWPRMQLERHSWHLQTPKCRFEACSRRHWTGPAVIGLAPSCAIAHSVVSWTVPEIMHWWEDLVLGTSVLFGVIFSISKPRYDFGEPSWEMVLFFIVETYGLIPTYANWPDNMSPLLRLR